MKYIRIRDAATRKLSCSGERSDIIQARCAQCTWARSIRVPPTCLIQPRRGILHGGPPPPRNPDSGGIVQPRKVAAARPPCSWVSGPWALSVMPSLLFRAPEGCGNGSSRPAGGSPRDGVELGERGDHRRAVQAGAPESPRPSRTSAGFYDDAILHKGAARRPEMNMPDCRGCVRCRIRHRRATLSKSSEGPC